jgi:hypothetical protein
MDPLAFSYDRSFVLDALRHGDIDYLENVSEAAEADLFRHLIRRQVVQRLADTYPSPRKKEEVPVWIYLASELSLKLHGAQSYHAFPRILRSGGLIEALVLGYPEAAQQGKIGIQQPRSFQNAPACVSIRKRRRHCEGRCVEPH